MDFSSIALLRGRDPLYQRAASLFTSAQLQQLYVALSCMDEALTQPRYAPSPLGAPGPLRLASGCRRRPLLGEMLELP